MRQNFKFIFVNSKSEFLYKFNVAKVPNYNSVLFNIIMLYAQIKIRLYSNYSMNLGYINEMDKMLAKIKSLIDERGLTIFKLTEQAGLSENTIYNWYNKGSEPTIRALKAICPYLKVSLAQLVSENKDEEMTYQENELIEHFRRLSESKKDIIIKLIKEIEDN